MLVRQYAAEFTTSYNKILNGMVERRMRQSIFATASLWYTAWVNAGQSDLNPASLQFSEDDLKEFEEMDKNWKHADPSKTCGI